MKKKLNVKVNSSSLSEARYCAGMGAAWLSLALLSPEAFKEIAKWVQGPRLAFCSEFAHFHLLPTYDTPYVETSPGDFLHCPRDYQCLIILSGGGQWTQYRDELLHRRHNIELIEIALNNQDDEAAALDIAQHFPLYINCSYPPFQKINQAVTLSAQGVSLTGSPEERTGLMDYTQLSEAFDYLEAI